MRTRELLNRGLVRTLLTGLALLTAACATSPEQRWREAEALDTPEAYRAIRRDFAGTDYARRAEARMGEIEMEASWEEVRADDTVPAYKGFIARWPDSPRVTDARARLDALAAESAPAPPQTQAQAAAPAIAIDFDEGGEDVEEEDAGDVEVSEDSLVEVLRNLPVEARRNIMIQLDETKQRYVRLLDYLASAKARGENAAATYRETALPPEYSDFSDRMIENGEELTEIADNLLTRTGELVARLELTIRAMVETPEKAASELNAFARTTRRLASYNRVKCSGLRKLITGNKRFIEKNDKVPPEIAGLFEPLNEAFADMIEKLEREADELEKVSGIVKEMSAGQ